MVPAPFSTPAIVPVSVSAIPSDGMLIVVPALTNIVTIVLRKLSLKHPRSPSHNSTSSAMPNLRTRLNASVLLSTRNAPRPGQHVNAE